MQHVLTIRIRQINLLYPVVVTCCVLTFLFAICITYEDYIEIEPIPKRDDTMTIKTDVDNISCYYISDGDVLPSAEHPSFSPNDKSIFLIDSTCHGKLTMLQACAAESAARVHPQWNIYLLFSSPINNDSLSKGYLAELLEYTNVKVARIHIEEYSKGTFVEPILVKNIKESEHPVEDTSNILRIVTLNKWGGIFLDNDMMVFRSFDKLPKNWVAKQDNGVSSRIVSFADDEVGRNMTNKIMKEIFKTYDPKSWHYNRREAITRVLKRICPKVFTSKSEDCNGVTVFARELFYPIQYPGTLLYLDNSDTERMSGEIEIPYTYHHLLKSMDYNSYQIDEDEWPFESLAKKFCPKIYRISR